MSIIKDEHSSKGGNMYYLVAADGPSLEAEIAKRFGHAVCHLLINAETHEISSFTGDVCDRPHHGLGRYKSNEIAGVITGNIGPHAYEEVVAKGWKVYIARNCTVASA